MDHAFWIVALECKSPMVNVSTRHGLLWHIVFFLSPFDSGFIVDLNRDGLAFHDDVVIVPGIVFDWSFCNVLYVVKASRLARVFKVLCCKPGIQIR